MTETVIVIVVLVVAAMLLVIAEICTPSFGLLALLALGCVGAAVYLCYRLNGVAGIVATIAVIIGLPAYVIAAVKYIPETRLGRRVILSRRQAPPGEGTPEAEELSRFVGRSASAETILRPSGIILVDGRRVDAQAESGLIAKGRTVKVIRAAGTYVVVREA